MKLVALEELDPGQIAKALSRYAMFTKAKGGVNNPQSQLKKYPRRSGNLETPVKPEHKGLMGQPKNPHGTRFDKLGREASAASSRPQLVDLGQPFERGLSDDPLDDSADVMPVDKEGPDWKTRREGPAEDPGRKRDGSLGFNRASQGLTRYVG